jgi:hypothetical protein
MVFVAAGLALGLLGLGLLTLSKDAEPVKVDIQPAYDGHRDLLKLRKARARALCELPTRPS